VLRGVHNPDSASGTSRRAKEDAAPAKSVAPIGVQAAIPRAPASRILASSREGEGEGGREESRRTFQMRVADARRKERTNLKKQARELAAAPMPLSRVIPAPAAKRNREREREA